MNSKNKGNSFERKIANRLSSRFAVATGLPNGFRRNPDSGSFFGGTNEAKVRTHDTEKASFGDIICPVAFSYNLECKHYKQAPSLSAIVEAKVGEWDKWIAQARQDSLNAKKRMALIVKYNNVRELVILDNRPPDVPIMMYYKNSFVVTLDDFLKAPDAHFIDRQGLPHLATP